MLDFMARCLTLARVGFLGIGYKKRVACFSLGLLFVLGVCLRPYFIANLSDLNITEDPERGQISSGDNWDKWSATKEEQGYRSIGNAFDNCDPKAERSKIGKVLVHFDSKLGTVVATVASNFTMPVSVKKGSVRVISQYHGRTMFNQTFNLCKTKVDTFKCPLKKGQKMRVYETFKLPKYIPKGHYMSKAQVSNQDGICFIAAESSFRI